MTDNGINAAKTLHCGLDKFREIVNLGDRTPKTQTPNFAGRFFTCLAPRHQREVVTPVAKFQGDCPADSTTTCGDHRNFMFLSHLLWLSDDLVRSRDLRHTISLDLDYHPVIALYI
jgi:hypothetical protein